MHLLLAVALAGSMLPWSVPVDTTPESDWHVPGRFVVHSPLDGGGDFVVLDVVPAGDPLAQAERLSERFGLEVAPLVMYRLFDRPEGEPLFGEQWSLRNLGDDGGVAGADIGAMGAWPWSRGEGVLAAVIDSGIDPTHPEFAGRLWTNPDEVAGNGLDDDGNGLVDDVNGWDFADGVPDPVDTVGHGTAVASVLAAAVNGQGMSGVAPEATLMPLKACAGLGCPADAVAQAILYAVDEGADVINLSLGAPGEEPLVTAAVLHARSQGVVVVAAAGNEGDDLDLTGPWTPVSIPGVIGVAWTDRSDQMAGRSNFGLESVDVAAPGDLIVTASPGGGYELRSGTSFSAPHVAGIAALMRAVSPSLSDTELALLLAETGDPLAGLATAVGSGRRVDAERAVQAARFRDVPGSVFAQDIMWAASTDITRGCTDVLFCPETSVTRGQMAGFLTRALGLPASSTADAFTDDDTSVFEGDIERLAASGITRGCNPPINDRFCPEDPVTRGQMAAFLTRALGLPASSTADAFTDDDTSVFEGDIERLAASGITRGCNPPVNDRFCPEDPVTRGELMAFLHRSSQLLSSTTR